MARRRDVFHSKVLLRLYPDANPNPVHVKQPDPVHTMKTPALNRNTVQDGGESLASSSAAGLRVYTALPPPADHQEGTQGASLTNLQTERMHSGGGAAESSDETDQDTHQCEEHRTRRRRRGKKRHALHQHPSIEGEAGTGDPKLPGAAGVSALGEGTGEHLSKNRRRKLKKKRHKEKLHSLGLVPRASALEFTYQRAGEEEEEEQEEAQDGPSTEELSNFLRSTVDMYLSHGSAHPGRPALPTSAVQDLLRSVAEGSAPPSVLEPLTRLMALAQSREAGRLAQALEDLHSTSPLAPEETAAVVPLFRYWITDILPMQRDAKD